MAQRIAGATKGVQRISQPACGCGCGGRDSWHARTLRRAVRNVRAYFVPVLVTVSADGCCFYEVAEAEYKHPWSTMRCVLRAVQSPTGTVVLYGWEQREG